VDSQLPVRRLGHLRYVRLEDDTYIFTDEVSLRPNHQSSLVRLHYLLWILRCWRIRQLRGLRWHLTYSQVLYLGPLLMFQNFRLGPVGGQRLLYKFSILSLGYRIRNLILTRIVYPVASQIYRSMRINLDVTHPALQQFFRASRVVPPMSAYDFGPPPTVFNANGRSLIMTVGRKIPVKLPNLTYGVFEILARRFPNFDFLIIGSGWGNRNLRKNFQTIENVEREALFNYYDKSIVNLFLSLELGGTVASEALSRGAVTLHIEGSGPEFLLGPSGVILSEDEMTSVPLCELIGLLANRLSDFISQPQGLSKIYQDQLDVSLKNRQLLDSVYDEVVRSIRI
jgi:glycosyltransferase involved in cell wall biosynthesis